uniref:Uncharacterized protein n=1 Tax=Sphaerodactylus townsendi TaxID=933632 RepID=A0ACB8EE06_9SAUR
MVVQECAGTQEGERHQAKPSLEQAFLPPGTEPGPHHRVLQPQDFLDRFLGLYSIWSKATALSPLRKSLHSSGRGKLRLSSLSRPRAACSLHSPSTTKGCRGTALGVLWKGVFGWKYSELPLQGKELAGTASYQKISASSFSSFSLATRYVKRKAETFFKTSPPPPPLLLLRCKEETWIQTHSRALELWGFSNVPGSCHTLRNFLPPPQRGGGELKATGSSFPAPRLPFAKLVRGKKLGIPKGSQEIDQETDRRILQLLQTDALVLFLPNRRGSLQERLARKGDPGKEGPGGRFGRRMRSWAELN